MRDLHNNLDPNGSATSNLSDNTAVVSGIVDLQGYEGVEFFIVTGTLADVDATFTTLLEEGDDSGLSDAAAVADIDLLGTEALASFTFADDDSIFKLGYIGTKRYVRLTVTPANNTGAAPITILPVRGRPHDAATANPPA